MTFHVSFQKLCYVWQVVEKTKFCKVTWCMVNIVQTSCFGIYPRSIILQTPTWHWSRNMSSVQLSHCQVYSVTDKQITPAPSYIV